MGKSLVEASVYPVTLCLESGFAEVIVRPRMFIYRQSWVVLDVKLIASCEPAGPCLKYAEECPSDIGLFRLRNRQIDIQTANVS